MLQKHNVNQAQWPISPLQSKADDNSTHRHSTLQGIWFIVAKTSSYHGI